MPMIIGSVTFTTSKIENNDTMKEIKLKTDIGGSGLCQEIAQAKFDNDFYKTTVALTISGSDGKVIDMKSSPVINAIDINVIPKEIATITAEAQAIIAHIKDNADISLSSSNMVAPAFVVPPGAVVVGVGGGIPGPMTGATTTPTTVTPASVSIVSSNNTWIS